MPEAIKTFKMGVRRDDPSQSSNPKWIPFDLDIPVAEGEEPIVKTVRFDLSWGDDAGAVLAMNDAFVYNRKGQLITHVVGIQKFLVRIMPPDDYETLIEVVKNVDLKIHPDILGDIFGWILEVTSDFPTTLSLDSSNGQRPTGESSTVAVS